jgi:hypothetical protein
MKRSALYGRARSMRTRKEINTAGLFRFSFYYGAPAVFLADVLCNVSDAVIDLCPLQSNPLTIFRCPAIACVTGTSPSNPPGSAREPLRVLDLNSNDRGDRSTSRRCKSLSHRVIAAERCFEASMAAPGEGKRCRAISGGSSNGLRKVVRFDFRPEGGRTLDANAFVSREGNSENIEPLPTRVHDGPDDDYQVQTENIDHDIVGEASSASSITTECVNFHLSNRSTVVYNRSYRRLLTCLILLGLFVVDSSPRKLSKLSLSRDHVTPKMKPAWHFRHNAIVVIAEFAKAQRRSQLPCVPQSLGESMPPRCWHTLCGHRIRIHSFVRKHVSQVGPI